MKIKVIGFIGLALLSTQSFAAPVNVNTATAAEIATALHGIGLKKAELIVEHCHKKGCTKPEDLLAVKGIGEKTLATIKPDLLFKIDK